jgi:deazaflavin-dependent oxidoreductase (nitroreductase family)
VRRYLASVASSADCGGVRARYLAGRGPLERTAPSQRIEGVGHLATRCARSYCSGVPSDLQLKAMNTIHRALLRISTGRLGSRVGGMPVLELTTTGRKSGQPHTVMLTSPVQDGDAIVIVASRGGDDHHPAWFLNLRDHPDVKAAFARGPTQPMHARVATPQERAALWPRVTSRYKGYASYQTKTDREIPLVILEPTDRGQS